MLLVDRTETLDGKLREPLAAAGFDVTSVETAGECLQAVEAGAVDAIASEFALPDLDGVCLLRAIRVSHPSLPFVLVPAEGSETVAGNALAADASGYVPPDQDGETAVDRLADALRRASPWVVDEGQQRYRHLIELSPSPINLFDADGVSIWCNDAALDLLGLSGRHELIGQSIFDFIHPEDHHQARTELAAVVERGESVGPTEMRLVTPDGEVRHVQISTATGQFLGAKIGQAVVVDVTERVNREQQLQVLDRWLRHNIRNETNLIAGLAGAIEDGQVEDVADAAADIREHATHLIDQANHERSVIDLLTDRPERTDVDVAKPSSGRSSAPASRSPTRSSTFAGRPRRRPARSRRSPRRSGR